MKRARDADLGFTLALALVALIPRLFVAVAWAREPVWDGHYYHFGAARIADGLGYSEDVIQAGVAVWKPWCHYPVGYSAALGLVYKVFGQGLWVAPVFNALIGTLTVVFLHRLARHGLSSNRARIAGAIAALHPGLVIYSAVVMTEGLAAFLLVLAPWAALRLRGRWLFSAILGGLILGLAALVRPSSLLALPLLAWCGAGSLKRAAAVVAVGTSTALITIAPWSLRNCMVMDGCALISTNGGWNLAIGAKTETGRFRTLRAADGCPIVTGQVQQDRCWARVGMAEIRKAPGRFLGLVPKKLGHTYDHESFPIEYLREADPGSWPEARRVAGRNLLSFFHRLLLVVAALATVGMALGKTASRRARLSQGLLLATWATLAAWAAFDIEHPFYLLPTLTPLVALLPLPGRPRHPHAVAYALGLLLVTSLTHAIFFGDDRYHVVATPLLCLLAAAAVRAPRDDKPAKASKLGLP
ncbi:MAG: glycosyltransferase family 39 protein [Polyangiaceae bacterium]